MFVSVRMFNVRMSDVLPCKKKSSVIIATHVQGLPRICLPLTKCFQHFGCPNIIAVLRVVLVVPRTVRGIKRFVWTDFKIYQNDVDVVSNACIFKYGRYLET